MSGERDRDSRDGTRRRERRVAVMNPKKFSASLITTISVEELLPERVFMIDTGAKPNLIKARNVHPDTQILREDKLHIVDVTDGFIESLGSIQISPMGYPLRIDVVPDNFPIPQEGILGTDFLKDSASALIQYDVQGFIKWHGITIPCTRQDTNSCQNGQNILYQNKKPRSQDGIRVPHVRRTLATVYTQAMH